VTNQSKIQVRFSGIMVSTMNEGNEDLFLEDDLNDIFVEGDESNGIFASNSANILDFSHSTVGSIQDEFLRRRSSTASKATIESNRSRQSSIDDDGLRCMTSNINPMKQQKTDRFQSGVTATNENSKKRSNKVGGSSETVPNKTEHGKSKMKQNKAEIDRKNNRGRQGNKNDDGNDHDDLVDDFGDNGKRVSNDVEIYEDEDDDEDNEDDVILDDNNSEDSTSRQLGMNDDSARDLDQLDVLPTDVFGKGGQQAWHSEENDKEHRKLMILEM
jgi:hypothetical protein